MYTWQSYSLPPSNFPTILHKVKFRFCPSLRTSVSYIWNKKRKVNNHNLIKYDNWICEKVNAYQFLKYRNLPNLCFLNTISRFLHSQRFQFPEQKRYQLQETISICLLFFFKVTISFIWWFLLLLFLSISLCMYLFFYQFEGFIIVISSFVCNCYCIYLFSSLSCLIFF